MKLRVLRFGFVLAIFFGLVAFIVGLINFLFPGYAESFMRLLDSIYPGYTYGEMGLLGVIVASLYALLNGFVVGIVLAFLFKLFKIAKI